MIAWTIKNLGIILNVIVLIFAIAMAIVPLRWDIVIRDTHGAILKYTTPGKFFILFSVSALGFGVWKILNDDKDSQENKNAVAGLKTELSTLNRKMDAEKTTYANLHRDYQDLYSLTEDLLSKNDNIASIVSKPPEPLSNPHLYLCPFVWGKSANPYMHPDSDTVHCEFGLCNDGTGVAVHLIEKEVAINFRGGSPKFWNSGPSLLNESSEIGMNQAGLIIPMVMPFRDFDFTASVFIFFSLYYESENGNKKKTFRKIFILTADHQMKEVGADQYSSIEKDLKKAKYW
jgi:hypothetical protein